MGDFSLFLRCLGCDESGAITIDWVVITSLTLLLGIAATYVIFGSGVVPLASEVNTVAESTGNVDPGPAPTIGLGN